MNIFSQKIIAIKENIKRSNIKAIKDYINTNFVTDVEVELVEGIVMELLDHNVNENRPTR